MKIAIDMDNTLIDELGSTKRPGIDEFLEAISKKHELIVWTNSTKTRALDFLRHHNLRKYFVEIIAREDYDPNEKGVYKNLQKYNIDMLIDDDPAEIQFNLKNKKKGILVESYRKNKEMNPNELTDIIKKYKLLK
jgi:phosphoglycolate phosphatase-like HAD superfamily hydrolase